MSDQVAAARRVVRARDVMTQEFATVDGLITVQEAVKIFREQEVRALVIRKRHQDDEYGLLLLSDIAKKVIARDRAPERVNVYEVMAKPVVAVDPQMDIRYCARLFESFGLAHVPVIDNGEVLGLISYRAIVLNGLLGRKENS